MGRQNGEHNRLYDTFQEMGWKFRPMFQTLGGAFTLDRDSPPLVILDPGGATRVVTLPAVTEVGLAFIIVNAADAAEDLTVNNPAAATIMTVSQNELGFVFCSGSAWYGGVVKQT